MKKWAIPVLASILILGLTFNQAYAQPIIFGLSHTGPSGPSTLFSIDPGTGTAISIGPTGFLRCSGMDTDAFGTVFATCTRSLDSTPVLVTIDTSTGTGTEVGTTGINPSISDISFRSSDGTLFAFDASNSPGHTLYTISPSTGAGSLVGLTGLSFDGGNGIAFTPTDILNHIARDNGHHTLDQTFGTASVGTPLSFPGGFLGSTIKAMDNDFETGTLYGIASDAGGGFSNEFLATINLSTFTVTIIGQTAEDMDAITVVSDVPVSGTSIPIDTTALLVAGAQTISPWLILGVVAAVGIGLAVFTLKRNH